MRTPLVIARPATLTPRAGLVLTALALPVSATAGRAQPLPLPAVEPRPGVGPLHAVGPAYDIAYRVGMPDPASHLYDVTVDVGAPAHAALGDTLRLTLPVWSPGRYARVDFARNVQDFGATDGADARLRWTKRGGSTWEVVTHGARHVTARYRVFANTLSGTYSVLDTAHANWNGAGLFMYVEEHKPDPVRLTVVPPVGWSVVNGVTTGGNGGAQTRRDSAGMVRFSFPNYDELIDTPTEVAPATALTLDSLTLDGRLYRVMVHHNGTRPPGAHARFMRQIRALVQRENRVIAPPPLRAYTFLFNIGYPGGDGMEHLYSTEIINRRPWTSDTTELLSGVATASHEYFHTWNVKRLRPAALGPFDYTEAQFEPSLWVAEGWTQYYGDLTRERAGLVSRTQFYTDFVRQLQGAATSPARLERSPRQASYDAPFFDGAVAPMATNASQTFLTYYTAGEMRALALDLMIRAESDGARSLDDVLRRLKREVWDDAPRASYYLQGRGYTEGDVERAASAVLGRDLHGWFDRYVGGTDDLPWGELFRPLGLVLDTSGSAWTLAEDPHATPAQVRLREGWLR